MVCDVDLRSLAGNLIEVTPVERPIETAMIFLINELDHAIAGRDPERFMQLIELMSNLDPDRAKSILTERLSQSAGVSTLIDYARSRFSIA